MRISRTIRLHRSRRRPVLGALTAAATVVALALPTGPAVAQTATSDSSPVNLSNAINLAVGKAVANATVVEGDARFEVLTPEVIRMEYSTTGSFLDLPTFDILDRDFTAPAFTSSVSNNVLTITTSQLTLTYRLGSGPFNTTNTSMKLLGTLPPGASANVTPTWGLECTFGQVCQSGAAGLAGGASMASDHKNSVSPAGFVAGLTATGAEATWRVLGAPAGTADVTIRYANNKGGDGNTETRTAHLVVNGTGTQVSLPATASWDTWSTVTVPVTLTAGTDTVAVECASGDSCNVNVDDIAVNAPGSSALPVVPARPLGGYMRSYDSTNGSYDAGTPTCASGQSGDACAADIPSMASGLLDESGWYLLDDSQAAVWTSTGWLANRPTGDIEDGYLFGYGQNYTGALADLAQLTGPATLPDESAFGNWLSQYYGYTTAAYQSTLLPQFEANGVSLDDLSVDTDWKSPSTWNGWEWNSSLFPDSTAFTDWAKSQDVSVALNVHAGIPTNDALYSQAQDIAGNTLTTSGSTAYWDWANVAQAESYFATADPTQNSVGLTWLDWCCDNSGVFSEPGVTPDSWINYLIAQQMVNEGQRGYVLSRIGASLQNSQAGSGTTGAWAEHRSTIAFTGDTQGTWNTLASEAQLAQDAGSIGEPYVSDDIGSFLGSAAAGNVPDDLYLRWLQLGTFQPVMREHSDGVDDDQNARLPWMYDAATQAVGDQFMQLREELVPYLYTLAAQAGSTGMPMTQALYLNYPSQAAAYTNPTEYTLGPDVLVAPVTQPGASVSMPVWFPPGTWQDYFTGATFTGPATQTITVPTSRMPVFVKEGGIVPLQPSSGQAQTAGAAPITLQVHAGASGSFSLYDDAGTGLGYESGQSSKTAINYTENTSASTLTISAASGSYSGEPSSRSYTLDLVDESKPTSVQVNGQTLTTTQWSYDSATHTLLVPLGAVPVSGSETVTQTGGAPLQLSEPTTPLVTFASPAKATAGQQVTISGSGFGASQGSSYLTLSDNGTTWGAPGDAATFAVNSWSDSAITFTVPTPSGTNGQWAVTPGSSATVSVTTGSGTSNTATTMIGSTTPPSGQVTGNQGLCLDDRSALTTNSNPVQVYTCNNTTAQQWTIEPNGTVQVLGMCLDVASGATVNGTGVGIYTCNNTGAQTWVQQQDGQLVNPQSGKCLDDSGNGGSGTQTVIYDCDGSAGEHWNVPSGGSYIAAQGQITGYQGLCLDDSNAATADGNPIQVFTCNQSAAQQWTAGQNDSLQTLGKCLDVSGGAGANGTVVNLYTCNGTGAQKWLPVSGGALINPQSSKCLEDNGGGGSGTHVIIDACNAGADQQWTLP
ncbi:ricin-type beta-trefoil lectin domain protein [Actinospica robiniae]|uniref:ricin-type beta-trefoil lectin domain protein n=1 Tax=Actinospica robiniae TaxID=304901 RepID=UPI000405AFC0|nr:ricin-type beta-trefoil lectin domain protein [Actinospica robiniae]